MFNNEHAARLTRFNVICCYFIQLAELKMITQTLAEANASMHQWSRVKLNKDGCIYTHQNPTSHRVCPCSDGQNCPLKQLIAQLQLLTAMTHQQIWPQQKEIDRNQWMPADKWRRSDVKAQNRYTCRYLQRKSMKL